MHKTVQVGIHHHQGEQYKCSVWAPHANMVKLVTTSPEEKSIALGKIDREYWSAIVPDVKPGYRYFFQLDRQQPLPDPASLSQPDGVHGASEVIDLNLFHWEDYNWKGIPRNKMIIYELHVGAFSKKGTFDGVIEKLPELADLGVNTIEIMPVAQFPGKRNWGYDGVYPFAVQHSYGGAYGLMNLVNECHKQGFAVVLDVVYNHLGPEGNYLDKFAPYFTDKYQTPWGKAVNFDDAYCDGVRNYFIQNAVMWFRDFHIDALRLDAIHTIFDFGAKHIMQALTEHVETLNAKDGRGHFLIAESNLNDVKYSKSIPDGGYGLHAQWSDDFHHALHALVTGEKKGYYIDYGEPEHLAKAIGNAFVLDGTYSHFRHRNFGNKTDGISGDRFVCFVQNHDQTGNRKFGERLTSLVSYEMLKAVAGCLFVAPYVPMLFMGEEYGEENPFLYFVDHNNAELNRLVREGREAEFKSFHKGTSEPAPDPADKKTFRNSQLKWDYKEDPRRKTLRQYYKELIEFRKSHPVLSDLNKDNTHVDVMDKLLVINRGTTDRKLITVLNLSKQKKQVHLNISGDQPLHKILDSAEKMWRGPGSESPDELHENDIVTAQPESVLMYTN